MNRIASGFYRIIVLAIILIALIVSCNKEEDKIQWERGDIVKASYLIQYPASSIETFIQAMGGQSNLEPEYDVEITKLVYITIGPDGDLVEASGTVMIPVGTNNLPLLSFHHGTETKRDLVVSSSLFIGEGIASMAMTSLGFATCVPDYLGLGESFLLHPYLYAPSSADVSIDLLRAARTFYQDNGVELNNDLYLGGYSEGGYVTMAVHREIETNHPDEFSVTASAPLAGPYDLEGTINSIILQEEYAQPTFIAYFITAYNEIYGWNRLNNIFNVPYAGMMAYLFDGNHTKEEIGAELPGSISELIKDRFRTAYLDGEEDEFEQAVSENNLLNWTPVAPIRMFHSNGDEIVPYQNSITALNYFQNQGVNNIELITLDSLAHAEAAVPAIIGMIEWFDSLRVNK
ncbi:MAG: hypothetical protein U9N53_07760 [Bacteroidota bacterium]|nr:hypothetical protein [Bacteroidota bacterium]